MSVRARRLALVVGVLLSALVGLSAAGPRPVAGSCVPLDLAAVARTEATSVFAGTVTRSEAGHVWVQVEQWFLGKDPVDSAEVIGGSQPNAITSADWTPSPGEQFLVVAERAAPTGFVTGLCQQMPVTIAVLQAAAATFGAPREPPFATATPAPAQGAVPSSVDPPLLLGALGLLLVLLAALVIAVLLRGRRGRPVAPLP